MNVEESFREGQIGKKKDLVYLAEIGRGRIKFKGFHVACAFLSFGIGKKTQIEEVNDSKAAVKQSCKALPFSSKAMAVPILQKVQT